MKTKAIIRIVLYCIVILLLVSILGGVLLFDLYSTDHHELSWVAPIVVPGTGYGMEGTYTAEGDPAAHIDIEWAAGAIIIQTGDVDQIQITESGEFDAGEALVYHQNGSKLTIRYQEENVYFGLQSTPSKDLTVTVPRDWEGKSIEIDAASAEVELRNITVREAEFNGASGACVFTGCTVEELDIDTASGDVEFSGFLGKLELDSMSAVFRGNFHSCPRSLEINSMSGDVELSLPSNCGFTAQVDALSGNFDTDFHCSQRDGRYIHGDGSCRISLSGMSGDIFISQGDDICYGKSTCHNQNGHYSDHHE